MQLPRALRNYITLQAKVKAKHPKQKGHVPRQSILFIFNIRRNRGPVKTSVSRRLARRCLPRTASLISICVGKRPGLEGFKGASETRTSVVIAMFRTPGASCCSPAVPPQSVPWLQLLLICKRSLSLIFYLFLGESLHFVLAVLESNFSIAVPGFGCQPLFLGRQLLHGLCAILPAFGIRSELWLCSVRVALEKQLARAAMLKATPDKAL